jgi:glycine betaine/proline transport system ATP-binding protein
MLELVGLGGLGTTRPDQLSGGMQQRVGLARALATDPEVMLFDEPFSALDPLIRRDMQDEVIRLRSEVNTTMMFITHDLSEALRLGDRIAIMRDGRFVQVGTPAEVVGAPADDYVENFVRDVSRSHVLAVESIMAPFDGADGDRYSARVPLGTKVRDVMGRLAHNDLPVGVVDGEGRVVGSVDRVAALRLVAGEDVIDIEASEVEG